MPMILGLIGGSGLLKTKLAALQSLTEEIIETPHGRVFLRTGPLGTDGSSLVFIQRHDAKPSRIYTQPADINYAALALALKAKVRYFPPFKPRKESTNQIPFQTKRYSFLWLNMHGKINTITLSLCLIFCSLVFLYSVEVRCRGRYLFGGFLTSFHRCGCFTGSGRFLVSL